MRIGIDAFQLVPKQGRGGGYYTFFKNLALALIKNRGANTVVIFTNSELAADLNLHLCDCELVVINLPARRNLWMFRLLWMHILLPVYTKMKHIDLLYFPFDYGSVYCPIPSVVTIHDLIDLYYIKYLPKEGKRFRMAYSLLMKRISILTGKHIMTVSEETRKDIVQHLVAPRNPNMLRVIQEGVAPEWFRVPKRCSNLSKPYIFSILSTSAHKNFDGLLKAYQYVRDNGIKVNLVLAGMAGQSHGQVIDALKCHPYAADIETLGYVNNEELQGWMVNAKVFVFVSKKEGFGLPILEAMAAGTPVVTSNISSMPEVAGDAAILVDPNDSRMIACAVEKLLSDEMLTQTLAKKGVKQAGKFSWNRTACELLCFFAECHAAQRIKIKISQ